MAVHYASPFLKSSTVILTILFLLRIITESSFWEWVHRHFGSSVRTLSKWRCSPVSTVLLKLYVLDFRIDNSAANSAPCFCHLWSVCHLTNNTFRFITNKTSIAIGINPVLEITMRIGLHVDVPSSKCRRWMIFHPFWKFPKLNLTQLCISFRHFKRELSVPFWNFKHFVYASFSFANNSVDTWVGPSKTNVN